MRRGVLSRTGGRLHVCVNPAVKFERDGWQLLSESPRFQAVRAAFPGHVADGSSDPRECAYLADTHPEPTILVTKDLDMQLQGSGAWESDPQDYRQTGSRIGRRCLASSGPVGDGEKYGTLDVDGYTLQAFASQEEMDYP